MSASVAKNEVTAAKRRAVMTVYAPDGATNLWRGASFVGRLFAGKSTATLVAVLGTMTNARKPLSFTAFTFTADSTTDRLTKTAHGLQTGDGPIQVSNSGGALPGGLVAATDYWVIKINDNDFKLATSLANAYLGTAIDITSNGTGTQTASSIATTERGLDGRFVYEFTQAETNVDGSELFVVADDDARVITADATTDELTLTAHELRTGQVVFVSNTGGGLPSGLAVTTPYWVIRVDANKFKLASTFANALAGTAIDLTSTGTGTHYVDSPITPALTSVMFANAVADFWNYVVENGHTAVQIFRGVGRTFLAKFSKTGNDYVFRDLADTKNSHSGTVTTAGRTTATITDLT